MTKRRDVTVGMRHRCTHFQNLFTEKAKKDAEAAAPSKAAPPKRLDNLFFIEEPKRVYVAESKDASL